LKIAIVITQSCRYLLKHPYGRLEGDTAGGDQRMGGREPKGKEVVRKRGVNDATERTDIRELGLLI
jgi:hypothetical protein